ncbi:hypothetical protein [Brachybacterium muris]|uniref:hypothetical protein n=2 Tax=Brachybacterium muris TaxID=219301 RepID=UPI0035E6FF09
MHGEPIPQLDVAQRAGDRIGVQQVPLASEGRIASKMVTITVASSAGASPPAGIASISSRPMIASSSSVTEANSSSNTSSLVEKFE